MILGIDPGLASTGYGVVGEGGDVVCCGSITTAPGRAGARLAEIVRRLELVIGQQQVVEAAMEELFMGRNRSSAIGVAQARGAILATLEHSGIRTFEYKPSQVKLVLTGYGMAGKAQMGRMLALQVRLPTADNHAADAVAIAICHLRSRRLNLALAAQA